MKTKKSRNETNETKEKIVKTEQKLARLERQLALDKLKSRKADTRRKIEFGGLVIKAKMDLHSKDVILGALLDAREQIERETGSKALFQSKGHAAFMNFKPE